MRFFESINYKKYRNFKIKNGIKKATEISCFFWSGRRDSNSRRSPWQGDALPLSHSRKSHYVYYHNLMDVSTVFLKKSKFLHNFFVPVLKRRCCGGKNTVSEPPSKTAITTRQTGGYPQRYRFFIVLSEFKLCHIITTGFVIPAGSSSVLLSIITVTS